MSVVLIRSTAVLLSEKLPNTCGSFMIYGAEFSSLQELGEEGYPS